MRSKTQTMTKWLQLISILGACVLITLWQFFHTHHRPRSATFQTPAAETSEPITPLPLTMDLDNYKVVLGEQLFDDPQLSYDNSISCSSCHSTSKGGTDQLIHSVGIGGQTGLINAPTSVMFRAFAAF